MVAALLLASGVALAATLICTSGIRYGTEQSDAIRGFEGADYILALGDDTVDARGVNSEITGYGGNDFISTGSGDDCIDVEGDGKRDIISCGPGTDYVYFDTSVYDPEIDLVF